MKKIKGAFLTLCAFLLIALCAPAAVSADAAGIVKDNRGSRAQRQ